MILEICFPCKGSEINKGYTWCFSRRIISAQQRWSLSGCWLDIWQDSGFVTGYLKTAFKRKPDIW